DGLLRRPALLVAENHGAPLSRVLGARCGDSDLLRLQHDLLSPIHLGHARYAASLSCVSTRAAGVERALLGRCLCAGTGLPDAARLSGLVAILGSPSGFQPMAGDRARMADGLAAADPQLRRDTNSASRTVCVPARPGAAKCLTHARHFS